MQAAHFVLLIIVVDGHSSPTTATPAGEGKSSTQTNNNPAGIPESATEATGTEAAANQENPSYQPGDNVLTPSGVAGATGAQDNLPGIASNPPGTDAIASGSTEVVQSEITLASGDSNTPTSSQANAPTTVTSTSTITSTETIKSTIISTTSTTKPRCVASDCTEFKKASQSAAAPRGRYVTACGRSYLVVANVSEKLPSSVSLCRSLSHALLSIETIDEFRCLTRAMPPELLNKSYWTSGSNEGPLCDTQNVHSWCTSGASLDQSLLLEHTTPALDLAGERCLAFSVNQAADNNSLAQLTHVACTGRLPLICEPPCPLPTCPAGSCSKNASLFDADGNLLRPESYGLWIEDCDNQYLFGNKPVTWEQNWAMCCSLGMALLVLDTVAEQSCLSGRTAAANWTGNLNYWTAGTQQGCRGVWDWCGGGSEARPFGDGALAWEAGQPDNKGGRQDCVHLRVVNGTGVRVTDRNCTDRYIFACEGKIKKKPLPSVSCPITKCTKNSSLFTSDGSTLRDYSSYGTWLSGCGRVFMFSKNSLSWEHARDSCCSIGLTLADLPSMGKHQCVERIVSEFIDIRADINSSFWVYGTDRNASGRFHWCSNERGFAPREVTWAQGEPSRTESCVYLINRGENASALAAGACSEERRFICDIRKRDRSSLAMQRECMETWDIKTAQIDLFTNPAVTSAQYTRDMKCFVKCMGEYAGMFLLGALVPGDTLRRIEEAYKSDPVQLQSGFTSYDECSSKEYDDECVTASETFTCGLQREPTIVLDIVADSKGNATVYGPPISCINPRHCFYEGKRDCNVSTALRNQFTSTGQTSIGKRFNMVNKPGIFISNFNLPNINLKYAYDYCCSLGMRLIEMSAADYGNLDVFFPNSGFIFVGETYMVDDFTDAWCRSKKRIPSNQYASNLNPRFPPSDCNQANNYLVHDVFTGTPGLRGAVATMLGFICENP